MEEKLQKFAFRPHCSGTDCNIKILLLMQYLWEIATIHALLKPIKRLEPNNDYEFPEQIHIPHSFIDMNGHINNTEYIRWAIEELKRKFQTNSDIRTIQVTYQNKVFEDDRLELLINSTTSPGYNADSKKSVLIMEIK